MAGTGRGIAMTTERMKDEKLTEALIGTYEREIALLREQLRLAQEQLRIAHDKMAEQVRQARWEVADEALEEYAQNGSRTAFLERIRDANAPKD